MKEAKEGKAMFYIGAYIVACGLTIYLMAGLRKTAKSLPRPAGCTPHLV